MKALTPMAWLRGALVGLAMVVAMAVATAAADDAVPVVLAAGDIADCERTLFAKALYNLLGIARAPGAEATAAILEREPGMVLALGDLVYGERGRDHYRDCFGRTWGRHRARIRPVPGNHDYVSRDAQDYFAYWGAQAGPPGLGYYSFEVGAWHLVALNSNIDVSAGSAQARWLERDLAASRARCVLAFWHHAIRSSDPAHGHNPRMEPLVRILHRQKVSVGLAGHGHVYERFAPQDASGRRDEEDGIRLFVVGTGGAELRGREATAPNSEAFEPRHWGVLRLALHPDRYEWRFLPVAGEDISDHGAAPCRERHPRAADASLQSR